MCLHLEVTYCGGHLICMATFLLHCQCWQSTGELSPYVYIYIFIEKHNISVSVSLAKKRLWEQVSKNTIKVLSVSICSYGDCMKLKDWGCLFSLA